MSVIATTIALAILAGWLYRELDQVRVKAKKFDDYCQYVSIAVRVMRNDLLNPTPPPWLEDRTRNWLDMRLIGDRTINDVDACARSKVDYAAIDERYYACTGSRHACLAAALETIERQLPSIH